MDFTDPYDSKDSCDHNQFCDLVIAHVYVPLCAACMSIHLYKLQVRARSDRVVGYVDLQEGVELVVAAAEGGGDGVDAIAPVQRI